MSASRLPCSTISIARKSSPPCSPDEYTFTMCGLFRLAVMRASLAKRFTKSGSSLYSRFITFTATWRPSFLSSARYTMPCPPSPRMPWISKFAKSVRTRIRAPQLEQFTSVNVSCTETSILVPQLGQMAIFGSAEVIKEAQGYTHCAYPTTPLPHCVLGRAFQMAGARAHTGRPRSRVRSDETTNEHAETRMETSAKSACRKRRGSSSGSLRSTFEVEYWTLSPAQRPSDVTMRLRRAHHSTCNIKRRTHLARSRLVARPPAR